MYEKGEIADSNLEYILLIPAGILQRPLSSNTIVYLPQLLLNLD